MSRLTYRILLVIVAAALALSPLRGVLALPVSAANDTSHCVQMQNGMHSPDQLAGMQDTTADNSDHDCEQGCGGDCCDGACNACAHGSAALSSVIAVTSDIHNSTLNLTVSYGVPGRTVHPPFRPPIFLSA
jgi:hypothetical protein